MAPTMDRGVPRTVTRVSLAVSAGSGTTGAAIVVATPEPMSGDLSTETGSRGVSPTALDGEAPRTGRTIAEVALRSASAFQNPLSLTTSNPATSSGAQGSSCVP